MFKITFSKKVKNDLINIKNYISEDNPIFALKTINSILKTIYFLEDFPFLWKELWDNLREIVEKNYKYKIVYIVENDSIKIISIYKYQNNWL